MFIRFETALSYALVGAVIVPPVCHSERSRGIRFPINAVIARAVSPPVAISLGICLLFKQIMQGTVKVIVTDGVAFTIDKGNHIALR